MKYMVVINEEPLGTVISLYKRFLFFWWSYQEGYKPLTAAVYLIDQFLDRCKKIYKDDLIIIDNTFDKRYSK